MAEENLSKQSRAPRRGVWLILALTMVVLALGVTMRSSSAYWLSQDEAERRAKEHIAHTHPGLVYDSISGISRGWNGHWQMVFDSNPPVAIDVARDGTCTER